MKKILIVLILLAGCFAGHAQVIRPFTTRWNNPSVRGNIVYVSNSIISTSGVGAGSPGTGEVAPAGTTKDNAGAGIYLDVDAAGPASTSLIAFGSNWRFHDTVTTTVVGSGRLNNWTLPAYNDAWWRNGNAVIYYNDAGTTLANNPGNNNFPTTYFRKTINIPSVSVYSDFTINIRRDDAAIVYVNGVLVYADAFLTAPITYTTPATPATNIEGANENVTIQVPASKFVNGNNTIAVEVHNQSNTTTANIRDMLFDLQLLGNDMNTTFSSSTADLTLPSCSQVLFAGLYWGADQGTSGTDSSWFQSDAQKTVKLKVPGGSYQLVTSQVYNQHSLAWSTSGFNHTGYLCFADITSLINTTNPNGTYTLANVLGPLGINNSCGGWTIVIAFANSTLQPRNLTIFDGSVVINLGDPAVDVPITGFLTPPTGPVSCEIGTVIYDGDRSSTDSFAFKQNGAASFYNLANPLIPGNALHDAWNSKIWYKGANVTTRNPAFNNTLGYDASIFDLPNPANLQLSNNQTSATVRFASPNENYFVHVVSTSISQYNPTFNFSKAAIDVNGGTLVPGDVIRYQISYQNNGNDTSTFSTIFDNIPAGTTYKPNSLLINGVAKSDGLANDEAEYDIANNRVVFRLGSGANGVSGGQLIPAASGTVSFEVYTPSSCAVYACGALNISNRARISYTGKLSGSSLYDSSGVILSGCNNPGPIISSISGGCSSHGDTLLINICPATSVTIPVALYGGYNFYSAMPFSSGNLFNPSTPISTTTVIYAYYDGPGSCDDTIQINVFRIGCPDIDDDDDGLPDYLEMNDPVALGDADGDGRPNWADPTPGGAIPWVDNNVDGSNDWYDPSADVDNDGIPNFYDTNFPGYVDSNGDGVNDNMDKDLDGIPNNLDLDSDNDGIPDTVESFGVDANGDGKIDNYSDTDGDGLSQNVDATGPGVNFIYGSGLGLGALDTDGDGIPNYLDLDSDNDGIPDTVEAFGSDSNNDGKVDGYTDTDGDGFSQNVDGDTDNNGTADNVAGPLLKTGVDANSDGRTDSWPNKNMDADTKPNPYDLDSDNDGITDVKEAGFADANWDGRVDGAINSNGRNSALAALGSLTIPNTDGTGRSNPYDIDSDDDGIPDNVEGLTTLGYLLPGTTDTDNDGLINTYDNFAGFGGDGIHPVDTDGDGIPDYMDSDTDSDGLIDRIEGNDLNFNGMPDDNVTLTGSDTDGDGLDNRFDANNSSIEGTSAYMGNGGTTSGDPTPGSTTTVQHTWIANANGCPVERDWRCITYVLNCEITAFRAVLYNQQVKLDWTALCRQEVDHFVVQRSTDGITFSDIINVPGRPNVNEAESYAAVDNNITGISSDKIYYRLVSKSVNGKSKTSNVIIVRLGNSKSSDMQVLPNPVKSQLQVLVNATTSSVADVVVSDVNGRTVMQFKERILPGSNSFTYPEAATLPAGTYYLRMSITGDNVMTRRFSVVK